LSDCSGSGRLADIGQGDVSWVVADPDGNEFCVLTPADGDQRGCRRSSCSARPGCSARRSANRRRFGVRRLSGARAIEQLAERWFLSSGISRR
jgi:hypothetical protein